MMVDTGARVRPVRRRWGRLVVGLGLVAVAVAANLAVHAARHPQIGVVQIAAEVPAGAPIEWRHLLEARLALGSSIPVIPIDQADTVIGRFARTRLVPGSLLTSTAIQDDPLITPGTATVAIRLTEGLVPAGLLERSVVDIVIRPALIESPPVVIRGRVLDLPTADQSGRVGFSVEVAADEAVAVALADEVRIVVVDPMIGGGTR